jgi:hypothetical protein
MLASATDVEVTSTVEPAGTRVLPVGGGLVVKFVPVPPNAETPVVAGAAMETVGMTGGVVTGGVVTGVVGGVVTGAVLPPPPPPPQAAKARRQTEDPRRIAFDVPMTLLVASGHGNSQPPCLKRT